MQPSRNVNSTILLQYPEHSPPLQWGIWRQLEHFRVVSTQSCHGNLSSPDKRSKKNKHISYNFMFLSSALQTLKQSISPFFLTNSPELLFFFLSPLIPPVSCLVQADFCLSGGRYLGLQNYLAGRWPKIAWCLPSFSSEECGTELYSSPFPPSGIINFIKKVRCFFFNSTINS